jgi:3-dehydroquinate synthase
MNTNVTRKVFEFSRRTLLASNVVVECNLLQNCDWRRVINNRGHKSNHLIVTDDNVGPIYCDRLAEGMSGQGLQVSSITLPSGESSKSLEMFNRLADQAIEKGIDKYTTVIGLGGGVVNNIAGFLASSLYRGVPLVQVPTSLLAQLDAAIDFKQGINGKIGKNHIGSIYPASSILVDPALLKTLPEREHRNGAAEAIKHALTQSASLFEKIVSKADDLLEAAFLEELVSETIELKIALLNMPVKVGQEEMVMQYGHAVGHALELLTEYKLHHGEAISVGMCVMAEAALELGLCSQSTVDAHYRVFKLYGLPSVLPSDTNDDDLLLAMRHDKHYTAAGTLVGLVNNVGSMGELYGDYAINLSEASLRSAFHRNRVRGISNE